MNNMNPQCINNHIPTQGSLEDLSKDEQNKLMRAMKKPEFMGLMNDYMLEISDPKNKEEYDQYLEQLARDGDLPKGLKLIRPDPEFCIKTTMTTKKDKGQAQKLFINICSTKVLGEPDFTVQEKDGQKGQSWSLPYSAGKIRYDQTKKEEVCNTIDVAFHPRAFEYSRYFTQFQQLVCQTGLDAARKQMGERTEDISEDYTVLQNMKCKGGTPALLTIRVSGKPGKGQQQQAQQQSETERRQGGEGQAPKLYRDIQNQKDEFQKQMDKEDEESKKKQQQADDEEQEEEETEQFQYNENGERIVKVPVHKFVYSYPVDYADFIDSTKSQRKRPIEIGLNVHLIGCESVKEVELDINEQKVILSVKNKYFLEKQLPYPVLADQGSAKFDSKKKILKIRLKVDKQALPPQENVHNVEVVRKHEEEEQDQQEDNVEQEEKQQQQQDNNEDNESLNNENNNQVLEQKQQQDQSSILHVVNEKQQEGFIPEQKENEVKDQQELQENEKENEQQKQDSDDEEEEGILTEIKPKIEEIQQSDDKQQEQEIEEKVIDKEKKILSPQIQEDGQKLFFIINLPKYNKEKVEFIIFEKQVLLVHEGKEQIDYLRVEILKDIDESQSDISFVTDYIVVNLIKKQQGEFWEKLGHEFKNDDYSEFKQIFQDLIEAKKIVYEQKVQELQEEQKRLENDKNKLEGLSDDEQENNEDEQKEPELSAEEQKRQEVIEQLKLKIENQANTVQFLDFRECAASAFDIE